MTGTYIALLRGVNAGGVNSLPMKDFVRLLSKLGLKNVKTYIQTGNAVFHAEAKDAAALPARIQAGIKRSHGFAPEVILLTLGELKIAISSNPYPEGKSAPRSVHLVFLASKPKTPDLTALEAVRKANERFALKGRVFYFHAPDGVGKSKLFPRIERVLGVAGAARNWRTADRLLELAQQVAAAEATTFRSTAGEMRKASTSRPPISPG